MRRLFVDDISDADRKRLVRALERRFGVSILPYRATQESQYTIRITDLETGSWIVAGIEAGRVKVRSEFDGSS